MLIGLECHLGVTWGWRLVFWLRVVRNESIEAYVLNTCKEMRMFAWLKRPPDPEFDAKASRLQQVLCNKWLSQCRALELIHSGRDDGVVQWAGGGAT
jgi:hypothetical protein